MPSPFREEHEQFRKTVRTFAQKELAPFVDEWEKSECFPNEVFKRAGELGLFAAHYKDCLLYTSPSPRDRTRSRMPSSA